MPWPGLRRAAGTALEACRFPAQRPSRPAARLGARAAQPDRGIAVVVQRVVGQVALVDALPDVAPRVPVGPAGCTSTSSASRPHSTNSGVSARVAPPVRGGCPSPHASGGRPARARAPRNLWRRRSSSRGPGPTGPVAFLDGRHGRPKRSSKARPRRQRLGEEEHAGVRSVTTRGVRRRPAASSSTMTDSSLLEGAQQARAARAERRGASVSPQTAHFALAPPARRRWTLRSQSDEPAPFVVEAELDRQRQLADLVLEGPSHRSAPRTALNFLGPLACGHPAPHRRRIQRSTASGTRFGGAGAPSGRWP